MKHRNEERPQWPSIVAGAAALTSIVLLGACDAPQQVVRPADAPAEAHLAAAAPSAEIFSPGVISDANWQYRITFSANGKTAYFAEARGFFPATRQATIYVSHLREGEWTEPEVAPFSGQYTDMDPFITPDGSRLYFSSIRPVDGVMRDDIDIWYVQRTLQGWSEPIHAGPEVNSPADELYVSAAGNGDLYFAVGPKGPTPGMDWDLYRAERVGREFAPREPLTAINTDVPFSWSDPFADWEFNPEISIDGRTLMFASLRPGGYGYSDLYVSHYHQGEWSTPQNLGPAVNTEWDEFHPTLSRDRRHLYLTRTLPARLSSSKSDFYRIDTRALELLR